MAMIYLKVWSWWRRVKPAVQRRNAQEQAELDRAAEAPAPPDSRAVSAGGATVERYQQRVSAGTSSQEETVVFVTLNGARDLPYSARGVSIARITTDQGEVRVAFNPMSRLNGSVLVYANPGSSIRVSLLGQGDPDSALNSLRLTAPNPATEFDPSAFQEQGRWSTLSKGGQLNVATSTLFFDDVANVVAEVPRCRSQLSAMLEAAEAVNSQLETMVGSDAALDSLRRDRHVGPAHKKGEGASAAQYMQRLVTYLVSQGISTSGMGADVGVTSSTSLSDKQRIKHLELENTLLKQEQAALEKLRAENSRLQELNAAGRIKELEEELEEVTAELLEMQQSKESTIQDLEQK